MSNRRAGAICAGESVTAWYLLPHARSGEGGTAASPRSDQARSREHYGRVSGERYVRLRGVARPTCYCATIDGISGERFQHKCRVDTPAMYTVWLPSLGESNVITMPCLFCAALRRWRRSSRGRTRDRPAEDAAVASDGRVASHADLVMVSVHA